MTGSTHVQGQTQGVRGFLHLQMLLWRQAQVSFPSHRPGNRGVHTDSGQQGEGPMHMALDPHPRELSTEENLPRRCEEHCSVHTVSVLCQQGTSLLRMSSAIKRNYVLTRTAV